jgi:uncharacterized OB-fold protein
VALDEDPSVRMVTEIVDCDPAKLRVAMAMEVVFRPLAFVGVDGTVVAPLWRPVD